MRTEAFIGTEGGREGRCIYVKGRVERGWREETRRREGGREGGREGSS